MKKVIILFVVLIILSLWYLFFQKKNKTITVSPTNTVQPIKKDLFYEKYKTTRVVAQGVIQSYRVTLNKIISGQQTYTIVFQLNTNFKDKAEASVVIVKKEVAQTIEKIIDNITIDLQKNGVKYPLSVFNVSFIQSNGSNIIDLPEN